MLKKKSQKIEEREEEPVDVQGLMKQVGDLTSQLGALQNPVEEDKPIEEAKDEDLLGIPSMDNFLVINEIPKQEVRKVKDEKTGKEHNLLTVEEALTELINRK